MSQQMDWTGYGWSAAEIYERHMVPAIFGPCAEDLPDRPAALREMHRVLVPGGRLALSV